VQVRQNFPGKQRRICPRPAKCPLRAAVPPFDAARTMDTRRSFAWVQPVAALWLGAALALPGCSQAPSQGESVPAYGGLYPSAPGCPASSLQCNGTCTDVSSDVSHCGGCGSACESGQLCQGGSCVCQSGQTECSGRCVDVTASADNCGSCGIVCVAPQVCSLGTCSAGCAAGLQQCGQACVNAATSLEHCGGCNRACGAGQSCNGGSCGCAGGLSSCGSECIDVRVNSAHCGNCETTWSAGSRSPRTTRPRNRGTAPTPA